MKKIIAYIFLIIIFFVTSVFPQTNYKIELSAGRISSTLQNTLLPYWDTGLSLGITASKQLNKEIELTTSFRIQNFKFQPNRVSFGYTTFEFRGFSRSVTGENSNVYNFSLGVRILSSTGRITTFFSFNGGFQYIDQGKIFITNSFDPPGNVSIPSTSETYLYNNSNKNYLMGIVELGAGLSFNIFPKINLITEGRLVTTFKNFTSYPVLSAGIQYSF